MLSKPGQTRPGKPLHRDGLPGTGEADIREEKEELLAGKDRFLSSFAISYRQPCFFPHSFKTSERRTPSF